MNNNFLNKKKSLPCPYKTFPTTSYWRDSVAVAKDDSFDPLIECSFKLATTDKIATAGSCFAQHIAKRLRASGFHYYVPENVPTFIDEAVAQKYNYGTFSARFGNIYTTRQLKQLFDRAFGKFEPSEPFWEEDGRFYDPFRPQIQPRGFANLAEAIADRKSHLRFVREMFQSMDVFVFTLGLTETWESTEDGAVFPICPGCGVGSFVPGKYQFINLSCDEVVADLMYVLQEILKINPRCRFLLTVSPVPLIATAVPRHVLISNTYSKSVLRVAVEKVVSEIPQSFYFPSFEIITGANTRSNYFESDLRSVKEEGVNHVMKVFFKHLINNSDSSRPLSKRSDHSDHDALVNSDMDIVCDEEILEKI